MVRWARTIRIRISRPHLSFAVPFPHLLSLSCCLLWIPTVVTIFSSIECSHTLCFYCIHPSCSDSFSYFSRCFCKKRTRRRNVTSMAANQRQTSLATLRSRPRHVAVKDTYAEPISTAKTIVLAPNVLVLVPIETGTLTIIQHVLLLLVRDHRHTLQFV